MSRPRSYTIAAILMLLYSLISIAIELPTLAQGAPAPSADAPPFALTILNFVFAILGIVGTYGVWRTEKWGVVLTIVVAAFGVLSSLPAIIFTPTPMRILAVVSLVWSVVIIVLLLQPTQQRAAA